MRVLDEIDERALRASRIKEPDIAIPETKARVYNTRVGKKRVTTLIEPEKHRRLRIATAIDQISMEEAFRRGLDLYLAQPRKD